MLTPDYFYGKSDKLIEMYQDLEDWILQDIAMRLVAAGSLSGTADRELWKLQQIGLHRQEIIKRISQLTGKSRNEVRRLLRDSVLTSFSDDESVLERLASVQPPLENNAVITAMNAEMMKKTGNPDCIFLHCLPSFHDLETIVGRQIYDQFGLTEMEVSDDVFRSSASKVFDEAENRMHTIKAVMVATIGRQ